MNFKGIPSAKNILLEYLLVAAKRDFNNIMFTYPEPLPDFPVGVNYIGRIIIVLEGQLDIFGSDGTTIRTRRQNTDKIVYTGENCWGGANRIFPYMKTVSAVFMSECIRIVATETEDGKLVSNPYYHTSNPPGGKVIGILNALNLMIYDHSPKRKTKALLLLKALLLESIDEVKIDKPHPVSRAEQRYKIIKNYIDNNYQMPVNRNDICHELGLNPCYVSRLFKKYHGDKINNYVEKCRMKKAQQILKSYNITIAQTARQCGYSSEAYFIKAFKKYFGMTPGNFRNSLRN